VKKWLRALGFAAGYLVSVLLVAFAWEMGSAFYWQGRVGYPLEQRLGFRLGTPYIRTDDGRTHEVRALEVLPGGAFERAGFRNGDIVRDIGLNAFFRTLRDHAGREVTIPVVQGGDGPPLMTREVRVVRIALPPAGS
jgi:hypothetical protein